MKKGIIISLMLILSLSLMLYGGAQTASIVSGQSFSIAATDEPVWMPSYGRISCQQTKLSCFPDKTCGDSENPTFYKVDSNGEWFNCDLPTLAESDYYDGCDFYIKETGILSFGTVKVCDKDKLNCASQNLIPDTSTFSVATKKFNVRDGQTVFINPNIADIEVRAQANVFGIAIEGDVKPQYSSKCNLASLLRDDQLALFVEDPKYATLLQESKISPGQYPQEFVIGYKQAYQDLRILEKDGEIFFVLDVGTICDIKRDTSGRLIVDNSIKGCKTDLDVQCIPGIGNCDRSGRLVEKEETACIPNTLINVRRSLVDSEEACRTRCNSEGTVEYYDCIRPQDCKEGEILNSDYICVKDIGLSDEEICEAKGNEWVIKETRQCGFLCDIGFKDATITTESKCVEKSNLGIAIAIFSLGIGGTIGSLAMRKKK